MTEPIDIAIVGGGISGVYCAWRLKRARPSSRIVLFEGSKRIGGRLLSAKPPGIPNMVAELGGMRILPAVQPKISRLIVTLNQEQSLKQPIELFDFPVDQPQNIAYLRGVYLRLCDFIKNPGKVPYHLSFLERNQTAGSIILEAIEQIVPGITAPGLDEYARRLKVRNAPFAGQPLYKQGFWNVLLRVISCEAYLLGVDAGGYNSTLTNWNAADAIPWYLSDFGIDPKYKGFKHGFQQVPLSLDQLFREDGGDVYMDHRVENFNWTGDSFELKVKDKTVNAKSLILAMPRRSLELLAPNSPLLNGADITQWIRSVTPRPLFKLFTTYSNPWWRSAGHPGPNGKLVAVEAGRSVTDLPVRQTYYWPKDDGTPATAGTSMLMASYDDGTNIGFWDGFRPQRRQVWFNGLEVAEVDPADAFVGTSPPTVDPAWAMHRAPARMVKEVARQLGVIHGLTYTPDVLDAAFRDWGDDPFGGGWNSWNIGVQSWDVKNHMIKPGAEPLYICGEAYSDAQGWVEGALQTADMVLEKFYLGPL